MNTENFKEFVKTGQALDSDDIRSFMDKMSNEARRITFLLNNAYRTPDEVRELLSELLGYKVPSSLRVFPPFYTDYGKNINIGEGVFINTCCHFQDHGGVTIGDGCQIGHNVVFATLNHELTPERRKTTRATTSFISLSPTTFRLTATGSPGASTDGRYRYLRFARSCSTRPCLCGRNPQLA